jgi:hypothetical protein
MKFLIESQMGSGNGEFNGVTRLACIQILCVSATIHIEILLIIMQALILLDPGTIESLRFSHLHRSLGLLDDDTDKVSWKHEKPSFAAAFDILEANYRRFGDSEVYRTYLLQACNFVLDTCRFSDMGEDRTADPVRRVFAYTQSLQDEGLLLKALDFAILRCCKPKVYLEFGALAKASSWDFLQLQ